MGSIFWMAFTDKDHIRCADDIDAESMSIFKELHASLLNKGIYLGPSGYEVGFVSEAHTPAILTECAKKFCIALDEILAK